MVESVAPIPADAASDPEFSDLVKDLEGKFGRERLGAMARLHLAVQKKWYPTKFFVPNRGQWRFVEMLEKEGKPPFLSGFLAGNGVGKTCFLVNMLTGIVYGREMLHPQWLGTLKIWDNYGRSSKGRLLCHADDAKPGGSLYDELLRYLPKGRYKFSFQGGTYLKAIEFDNGVVVQVRTHDQPVTAHAGPNLDWIMANEPMPQPLFGENVGRLRNSSCPLFAFFMTPLNVSAWLYEQVVDGADGVNTDYVSASIWDNCRDIPNTRGVLPKENIERLIEQWRREDPEEAEARETGVFQHLSGRVFKAFDRHVHVVEEFPIPKDWNCSVVMDPHDIRPPAVTFWAQDPLGTLYCVGEYPEQDYRHIKNTSFTYDHFAEAVKAKMRDIAPERQWMDFVMDPNKGEVKTRSNNRSIRNEYVTRGLRFRTKEVNDDLSYGHKSVQERLFFDDKREIGEGNHPRIYFFSKCRNTIQAMMKYSFRPEGQKGGTSLTSKLEQDYKDFADNVRYRCVSLLGWKPVPSSSKGSTSTSASESVRRRRLASMV